MPVPPTAVAKRFLTALERGQWADAVGLVHPDSRRKTRTQTLAHLLAWARFRSAPAPADHQGAVAFGSSGRFASTDLREMGHFIVPTYRGSPTIQSLAALSTAAFVERLLDAANAPDLPSRVFRILQTPFALGHVMDGPRLAHVVLREGPPGPRTRLTYIATLPLQRAHGTWRVRLTHDIARVHLPMSDNDPLLAGARLGLGRRRLTTA